MKHIKIVLVMVLLVAGTQLHAQTKPVVKPIAKYKVPKLFTQIGSYRDSVNISVQEAENIISQPLRISDEKNGNYSISSYQFLYKKRVVTENEETGKVSPTTSIVSSRFKITPLPDTWASQVREQVKPGEELFFFDVIAKDAQGRVMYAPNLKIMVK
jgi:hypothetical protein